MFHVEVWLIRCVELMLNTKMGWPSNPTVNIYLTVEDIYSRKLDKSSRQSSSQLAQITLCALINTNSPPLSSPATEINQYN